MTHLSTAKEAPMKLRLTLAAAALASLASVAAPALAQHKHGPAAPAAQSAAPELADGEVRRVDAAKGTILLKHGEIRSINMGAMTMGFKLKDAALAAGLQPGDKVKFAVEQQGETLIVTKIEKIK
jgi:Cu(I)/Ag(I) efflux system periplasmic protein CusF